MNTKIDELLHTLDLCADSLPCDLVEIHAQRIQTINRKSPAQLKEKLGEILFRPDPYNPNSLKRIQ
jgi:hypothetical protein